MSKTLLLTRCKEDNLILKKRLNHEGYICFEMSLLRHRYKNFDYKILDHFNDIIVTSKRAAKAIPSIINSVNNIKNAWVVGKISAAILENKGYKVKFVANSANELVKSLPSDANSQLIYLAGNNISVEMPSFVKTVEIYKISYKDSISETEINLLKSGLSYILLYSENCAKTLLNLIVKNDLLKYLENSVIIAISSKVAKPLAGYFKNVIAASSAEQMIEELEYYDRKKSTE